MQKQETKQIYETNLNQFLISFEEAILEGFRLSNKNEHAVSNFIGNYEITLVRFLEEDTKDKETVKDVPKVTKGRKSNNKK